MKKVLYSFTMLIFIFSCKTKEPQPPVLEIQPIDSIVECSNVKPAFFKVSAFANEDLLSFSIETEPIIYRFDTSFRSFTHNYVDSFSLAIPENVELDEDSIIIASFSISDHYNTITIVKYLKVVDAYPDLIQDTLTFYTPKVGKGFFDLVTHSFLDTTADPGSFDLAYALNTDGSNILCSPNAPLLAEILTNRGISYSIENQRNTKINRSLVDYGAMDDRYIYYMTVTERYLYNTPSDGIGVEALTIGNTLIFEAQDGRKGAIKILNIHPADSAITIAIKYQYRVNE